MIGAVLATENLSVSFGGPLAVNDVSLRLESGARHALIGPNGAGKSTVINLITGVLKPSNGKVFLDGAEVTHLPAEGRVRRGLARTFQINQLFPGLTALQATALAVCQRLGLVGNVIRRLADCGNALEEASEVLGSLGLDPDCPSLTRELPYGRQRLLEIALALASRPRVLLLDEPAAGVPAKESAELFLAIERLPREVAVLFIEHDMELVFRFAERVTVMVAGRVLCEGPPAEIATNVEVRSVYLGEDIDG